jgi:hypothetical protein
MKAFTGYPELFNDEVDGSNPAIVFKNGMVVAVGTEDSRSDMERLVACWNACRKIFAPAAHIEATDEQVQKVERLRKEAWSLAGALQVEVDQLKSSSANVVESMTGWSFDVAAAPRGKTFKRNRIVKDKVQEVDEFVPDYLWVATKCGKVNKSYFIPQAGKVPARWSGLATGEDPVAWCEFIIPEFPSVPAAGAYASQNETVLA